MVLHADDSLYFLYRGNEAHAHTQTHTRTHILTHTYADCVVTALKHPLGYCRNMRPTAQNWWNTNAPILWLQKTDLSRYTSDPSCTHTHTQTHDDILPMIKWRRRRRRWMPGCCPCLCHGDEQRCGHWHLFSSRHPSSSRSPQTTRTSTSLVQKQKQRSHCSKTCICNETQPSLWIISSHTCPCKWIHLSKTILPFRTYPPLFYLTILCWYDLQG